MSLQGESVEQSHPGLAGPIWRRLSFLDGVRYFVPGLADGHLPHRAQEHDLFGPDQRNVSVGEGFFRDSVRDFRQQGVISDLRDDRLSPDPSAQILDDLLESFGVLAANVLVLSEPELHLRPDGLRPPGEPLSPVLEDARFPKSVLGPPEPYVAKLLEELSPRTKSVREAGFGIPPESVPKGDELFDCSAIGHHQVEGTAELLLGISLVVEILVGREEILDLTEPLHLGDTPNGTNESID
jgi:hypothetical protein